MQLRPEQLTSHLAQDAKKLKPIYTVHSNEHLLLQEAVDAIRACARQQGFSERQVFTVAGGVFDWREFLGAAQSRSLFAERQLIEIRIPAGKPGKEGSDALQRYCEMLSAHAEETLCVVSLPRLDRTQLNSAWFSALDLAGVTLKIESVPRQNLPVWIAQRLGLQGHRVEDGDVGQRMLDMFADRVEGNLLAAHQEIQKLALLYPPGILSEAQLTVAVFNVARYDVFKLTETLLAGQVERTLRMLDGLQAEGEAAVLVHWALSEDIRALKKVKDAVSSGKPLPLALREQKIWGIKEKLFERIVPGVKSTALGYLIEAAHICDGIIKGLPNPEWPKDPWEALQRLALMLITVAQGKKSPSLDEARLVLRTRPP